MKKTLLLCVMGIGVFAFADFSRSNGVVTDNSTKLQWQDDYSDNDGNITYTSWSGAIDYCEALTLDKGNWRLPNINELNTMLNYNVYTPAIYRENTGHPGAFQNSATANGASINPPEYSDPGSTMDENQNKVRYWSSTTIAGDDNSKAWYVNFCKGFTMDGSSVTGDSKEASNVVRCVRGPATPK